MSFFGDKSLDSVLKSFSIQGIQKGVFPHSFITKDILSYIGPKPDIQYYNQESVSNDIYDSIPKNN
jgi:hypothetical protein